MPCLVSNTGVICLDSLMFNTLILLLPLLYFKETTARMKKFIISFDFKGLIFSAKVLVKRIAGVTLFSTTLIGCELDFLLRKATLIFLQKSKGYELIIFKKDRTYEIVEWKIIAQYVDKSDIMKPYSFSLS